MVRVSPSILEQDQASDESRIRIGKVTTLAMLYGFDSNALSPGRVTKTLRGSHIKSMDWVLAIDRRGCLEVQLVDLGGFFTRFSSRGSQHQSVL